MKKRRRDYKKRLGNVIILTLLLGILLPLNIFAEAKEATVVDEKESQRTKLEEINFLYKQALINFRYEDYQKANELFKEILSLDPTQERARNYVEEKIPRAINKDKIAALYPQALDSFKKEDYETASELFEKILSLDPRQKKARVYLEQRIPYRLELLKKKELKLLYSDAVKRYNSKDYAEAKELFQEILSLSPNHRGAKLYLEEKIPLKLEAMQAKKEEQAEAAKRRKIADLYAEAFSDFNDDEYEEAKEKFKEILSLDPDEEKAKTYLEEKIPQAINKEEIDFLYDEALADFQSGDYRKASEEFEEILALDSTQEKARQYLEKEIPPREAAAKKKRIKFLYEEASTHFYKGNYQEANKLFKEILSLDPSQEKARVYVEDKIPRMSKIDFLYRQAFTYFYNEDYKKAGEAFEQIVDMDPSQEKARIYAQRKIPLRLKQKKAAMPFQQFPTLREEERPSRVVGDIVKEDRQGFVIIKSKNPIEILEDADYLYQMGEYEEALVFYNEVYNRAQDPLIKKRAEMARDIVDALLRAERESPEEAADDLEHAVKIKERLKRNQISSLYKYALNNYRGKDYEKASEAFKTILSMDPNQEKARAYLERKIPAKLQVANSGKIKALYTQALGYFRSGDYQRSKELFEEILYLDPNQRKARVYLNEEIPQAMNKNKIRFLYSEGITQFKNGNYQRAQGIFKEILSLDPNHGGARAYLEKEIPDALARQRKDKERQEFARQRRMDEELGYLEKKKEQEVIYVSPERETVVIEKETLEKPSDYPKEGSIGYLYEEAFLHYYNGEFSLAESYFKKILLIDPTQALASIYLGNIKEQLYGLY